MGLGESKDHNKELKLFPEEERNQLERNFERLSKGSKTKVDRQTLQIYIKNLLETPNVDSLICRIVELMAGQITPSNNVVTFEGYVHCAFIMMTGLLEDKASQVVYMAKSQNGSSYEDCLLLTKQLIEIGFKVLLKSSAAAAIETWDGKCTHIIEEEATLRLASALTRDLKAANQEIVDRDLAVKWLSHSHLFLELLNIMAHQIFQLPIPRTPIVPLCLGLPTRSYPSWLTLADVVFINTSLPSELRSEWRFLFSSRLNGESFSSLMGNIVDKGPTIILIKDTKGHIFGGFASTSWTVGPQFSGTSKNFIFSLSPNMAIYNTTGFNGHFQYLNIQQQTFPNGLGMGGQLQYFGLWLDAEYGKGKCAPSCTTYNSPQLSSSPEFLIDRVEVWAVGPEPINDEEEGEIRPSILDVDVEGTAMLKMLNRGPVSEGLRENPTADEPEDKELYIAKSE